MKMLTGVTALAAMIIGLAPAAAKQVDVALPFDKDAEVVVLSARSVCSIREQVQTRDVIFDGAQLAPETARYLAKRLQAGAQVRLVVEMHRFTVESGRAHASAKLRVQVPAWLTNPKAGDAQIVDVALTDDARRGAASVARSFRLVGVQHPSEITVAGRLAVAGRCMGDRAKDQAWATARLKVKLVLEE